MPHRDSLLSQRRVHVLLVLEAMQTNTLGNAKNTVTSGPPEGRVPRNRDPGHLPRLRPHLQLGWVPNLYSNLHRRSPRVSVPFLSPRQGIPGNGNTVKAARL
jgi:hypothetical protein